MPLDAAKASAKLAAIKAALAAIGTAAGNGTAMPRGGEKNTGPIAWEYLVAKTLREDADARMALAHKAVVKAGMVPDHKRDPLPVGTDEVVYDGELVRIELEVTTPATRLDVMPLLAEIEKAGVPRATIDRLVEKHTLTNAAPHRFTASLVTA